MNKKASVIAGLLLAVGVGCSNSSSTRKESSPAPVTSTSPAGGRSLAVTVPPGPDEPVKVTITVVTTTTTTSVAVAQSPDTIPSDLLFAFDSARLSDDAGPILARILSAVTGRVVRIEIDAHTDSDGGDVYNLDLAERRGQAVADWFVRHAVPKSLITVTSWGESKPVAPNDTPQHQAMNRRVELTIQVSR